MDANVDRSFSRREALVGGGLAVAGAMGLTANAAAQDAPTGAASPSPASPPAQRLSAYQCDKNIWVRINDATFCCYRAGQDQKYPYFYPLVGPRTGLGVTEESSVPWPHHRSMFFGCDHVNGGNYWQDALQRGQIVSRGPKIEAADERAVVIADVCDWRSGQGQDIIEDARSYRITAPDASTRILDCRFVLTARTDIQITKTNHSLFAVRAATGLTPLGGGKLVNSAGKTGEKGTFGEPAPWCGFEGTRFGQAESVVVMDHPGNPWHPGRWFTRDYGFASPTPFFWIDDKEPWRLPSGDRLSVRYAVLVSGSAIDPDRVNELFRNWSASA
jgi:hypothetical protein